MTVHNQTVTVTVHNQSVTVHNQTVTVHNQTVTVHKQTVTVHKQTVTVHNQTVTVHNQTVTVHKQTVTVHNQTVAVHNQTSHRQVHLARTHIDRQHTATYQINDANNQRSSNSTKHERQPPEDGQTIVTEICRILMMCFTDIFNNLVF